VTVDTSAPSVPVLALKVDDGSALDGSPALDNISLDGTVAVTGLEAGATWEYTVDGVTTKVTTPATGANTESFVSSTVEGAHKVTVQQTDAAGNPGAVSAESTFTIKPAGIPIVPDATGLSTVLGTADADTFIYDVTGEAGKIYGNDGDATIGNSTVIGNFDPAKDKIMLDNSLATALTTADLTTGLVGSSFAVTPDYFGNKTTITFDSKVDGTAEAITLTGVTLDQATVLPLFVFA
jgi:hypothetical protein